MEMGWQLSCVLPSILRCKLIHYFDFIIDVSLSESD
jgi:hypothetical protein